jgi:adenine-specific DNA-methyltransferase
VKPIATYQKIRGGYYTPEPIGEFLASWAVRAASDAILEPSCGDGVLLQSAANALLRHGASPEAVAKQLCGVEADQAEARKARKHLRQRDIPLPANGVQAGDFFTFAETLRADRRFDVVIGNPPFIRFQHFSEERRKVAFQLMNRLGLHPNRLTNAWVPFVCVSAMLLKPRGRLAMVVPAELMQVSYTSELRLFLSEYFCRLVLITFRKLVFPDIQQEVVLLCAEKNDRTRTGINVVELNGVEDLRGHVDEVLDPRSLKPMDHSTEKWTQYYLARREISLVRAAREDQRLHRLGDLASVDVGVVTGLNEYFVLSEQSKRDAGLNGYTQKIVTRSGHLKGTLFTEADWKNLAEGQQGAHLLSAPAVAPGELPNAMRQYVREGQRRDVHKGFKCRIRKLWYVVPSVWNPDAFLLRQIHRHPKLVVNEAGVTCTDTIHRVRLLNGTDGRRLAVACLNSLTFAFSEIAGRSYGGGVLELEPREAEQLPIPFAGSERIDFDLIHRLVSQEEIEKALDVTDQVLLREELGMSDRDVIALRRIWKKLRDRRLHRKNSRGLGFQPDTPESGWKPNPRVKKRERVGQR